ncbi:MAG: hypothetical protein WAT70_05520 [Rhizobiaceae bacterium]
MRTFLKSAVATVAVAAMLATTAYAQVPARDHFMTSWDENGDGKVTLQEATNRREALFASFDANENGKFDPEELAAMDDMRDAMRADVGGMGPGGGMGRGQDGSMKMGRGMHQGQGWGNQQGQGYGMHQGQGWGNQQGQGWGQQQGQGWGMRQGQGHNQGMGQGPRNGMGQAEQGGHRMMDTDGDGVITKAEFVGSVETWFARRDRNGDGVIDTNDF